MKMVATNALADIWLSEPRPSEGESHAILLQAIEEIQKMGVDAMRELS